ncbi:MAG: hypothetical protein GKS00_13480 [Alphaproteobacteria bacterium]|nr:hypothetical protein [Alphaproteobacteria bacterium]
MRQLAIIAFASLVLAACQTRGPDASADPYYTGNVIDYYFGKVNPTDNDPDFTYGNDIDGAG